MWSCISCEMWSAYKMWRKGLITKCVPVLKDDKGKWVRNPQIITETYVKDGDLVYGEMKSGDEFKQGREWVNNKLKNNEFDFTLLDGEVDKICWTFANLFPGCLITSIHGIRNKKKFFWDQSKNINRHRVVANMTPIRSCMTGIRTSPMRTSVMRPRDWT